MVFERIPRSMRRLASAFAVAGLVAATGMVPTASSEPEDELEYSESVSSPAAPSAETEPSAVAPTTEKPIEADSFEESYSLFEALDIAPLSENSNPGDVKVSVIDRIRADGTHSYLMEVNLGPENYQPGEPIWLARKNAKTASTITQAKVNEQVLQSDAIENDLVAEEEVIRINHPLEAGSKAKLTLLLDSDEKPSAHDWSLVPPGADFPSVAPRISNSQARASALAVNSNPQVPEYKQEEFGDLPDFSYGNSPRYRLDDITTESDNGVEAVLRFTFEVENATRPVNFGNLQFNPRAWFCDYERKDTCKTELGTVRIDGQGDLWINTEDPSRSARTGNINHNWRTPSSQTPYDEWSSNRVQVRTGDRVIVRYTLKRDYDARRTFEYREPNGNEAKIVVQVGSDLLPPGVVNGADPFVSGRLNSVKEVSEATGATLRLHRRAHDNAFGTAEANDLEEGPHGPGPAINEDWAVCEVDALGECVFYVPVERDGKYNYYWVKQETATPGYKPLDKLRIGGSGSKGTFMREGKVIDYSFATPNLEGGKTYYSGKSYHAGWGFGARYGSDRGRRSNSFMYGHTQPIFDGNIVRPRNSMGVIQQVRDNVPPPAGGKVCSAEQRNIAAMVDLSGSIGKTGAELQSKALKTIIGELEGTYSTLSIGTFATSSPHNRQEALGLYDMQNPADVSKLTDFAEGLSKSFNGATNWDAGFRSLINANKRNSANFDLAFFITDGNPTHTDRDGFRNIIDEGAFNDFRHVEAAIAAANTLKSQGTRVVAVGVPSYPEGSEKYMTVSETNLAAISGPKKWDNQVQNSYEADHFRFDDIDAYGKILASAVGTPVDCVMEVEKRVATPGSEFASADNSGPGGSDWQFDLGFGGSLDVGDEPLTKLTDDTSKVSYTFSEEGQGEVLITEDLSTARQGRSYQLLPVKSGKNGVCYSLDSNGKRGAQISDDRIDNIDDPTNPGIRVKNVSATERLSCTLTNVEKKPTTLELLIKKLGVKPGGSEIVEVAGAEFELSQLKEDGTVSVVELDNDGGAEFRATLEAGRYRLVEKKAPEGYSLLPQPVEFEVLLSSEGQYEVNLLSAPTQLGQVELVGSSEDNPNSAELLVTDQTRGELPKTGGHGLFPTLLLGLLVIVLGAAYSRFEAGRRF
ncbi:VWA domain-containing protein [Corynebacterium pilosum]|uniref:Putative surface-anchored fimbrial subunit n=1 Tax=Corynebacterium pilosum TaxID=35756 RepID=A0A376CKA6_9CORY|nr:VWA domain-containing protein [Corynebacterium pilosum]STC68931.1 putative surface-anchored fimbrial subunit [Corynebacterium pilosum]